MDSSDINYQFYYKLRCVQSLIHVPLEQKDNVNKMLLDFDRMYTDILNKNQFLICELNKMKHYIHKLEYDMNSISIENKSLTKSMMEKTKCDELRPLSPPGLYPTLDNQIDNVSVKQNETYQLFPNTSKMFLFELNNPVQLNDFKKESILDKSDKEIEPELDQIETNKNIIKKKDFIIKKENKNKNKMKTSKNIEDIDKKWERCSLFNVSLESIHKILTAVMHVFYSEYYKHAKYDDYFSKEIVSHCYGTFFIDIIHNSKLNTTFLYLRENTKKLGNYFRKIKIEYKIFNNKKGKQVTHFFYKE